MLLSHRTNFPLNISPFMSTSYWVDVPEKKNEWEHCIAQELNGWEEEKKRPSVEMARDKRNDFEKLCSLRCANSETRCVRAETTCVSWRCVVCAAESRIYITIPYYMQRHSVCIRINMHAACSCKPKIFSPAELVRPVPSPPLPAWCRKYLQQSQEQSHG